MAKLSSRIKCHASTAGSEMPSFLFKETDDDRMTLSPPLLCEIMIYVADFDSLLQPQEPLIMR